MRWSQIWSRLGVEESAHFLSTRPYGIPREARSYAIEIFDDQIGALGPTPAGENCAGLRLTAPGDDTRAALSAQADVALETRVTKLLGTRATETDPLDVFKPQVRSAHQHVISLIYDLASNSAAAAALVDKILTRLSEQSKSTCCFLLISLAETRIRLNQLVLGPMSRSFEFAGAQP